MQTKHKYIKGTDNINRGKLVIAWLRYFYFFFSNWGNSSKSDSERSVINPGVDLCVCYCWVQL